MTNQLANNQIYVHSTEEMLYIAEKLAQIITEKTVILLDGEMGAGKTTFTKGFAKGLGIEQMIKSPTYTIVKEYQATPLSLYHFDAYRLEDIGADGLGFEEYFDLPGVVIIEWSQFIQEILPEQVIRIRIEYASNAEERLVTIEASANYCQLVENWMNKLR